MRNMQFVALGDPVTQLPPESGELQYRVKCKGDTFERVARESELSRRSAV
jgi:hypothetical protein